VFVATCDRGYLIGLEVMLKSLVDFNPRVSDECIEVRVISNDPSDADLSMSRAIHGNIDLLIDFDRPFGATRDPYIDQYNTGVMAIVRELLSEKIFSDFLRLASVFGRTEHLDQDIINKHLRYEVSELPVSYNFLKTYHKPVFRNSELAGHIRILHCIAKKPWQNAQPVALEEGTL